MSCIFPQLEKAFDPLTHKQQLSHGISETFFYSSTISTPSLLSHVPMAASTSLFPLVWGLASLRASLTCWISCENFESIIFVSRTTVSSLTNSATVNRIATTDKTIEILWRSEQAFSVGTRFGSLRSFMPLSIARLAVRTVADTRQCASRCGTYHVYLLGMLELNGKSICDSNNFHRFMSHPWPTRHRLPTVNKKLLQCNAHLNQGPKGFRAPAHIKNWGSRAPGQNKQGSREFD